ncbi:MAG TPA: acyltransferase [Chthonomonadaceae bacterium]|nr:acyltransferase [Chthonomonadaceae bacterium]
MAAATPPAETVAESAPRVRLAYLDGLRGLCALFVVGGHTGNGGYFHDDGSFGSRLLVFFWNLLNYDRYAVAIFIILSSYCLMLPVARSADGRLPGGVWEYLKRRARRILPPYYAALALSLLLLAALSGMKGRALTEFSPGAILSHLFLVHNLKSEWTFAINGPMWSVATEWQIYFFFPALLLPAWRSRGIGAAALIAFVLGYIPHFVFHKWLDPVAPWFLGLFALGMAGAVLGFDAAPRFRALRLRLPWGLLAAALSLALGIAFLLKPERLPSYPLYLTEPFVGLAAVCLIVYCTRFLTDGVPAQRPAILRLLESRPFVGLGAFSYSLYLTHAPFLDLGKTLLKTLALSDTSKLLLLWFGIVPLCVLAAYLFYLPCERPFLSSHRKGRPLHS